MYTYVYVWLKLSTECRMLFVILHKVSLNLIVHIFVSDINLSFTVNGQPHKMALKVPIAINKFMEPTEMNGEAFFARWKNLST